MINLEGQFLFDIEVGDYKNFIQRDDLYLFRMVEEAGNNLPYFDLKFRFFIPELRNYLIENNVLKITMGSSESELTTTPFRILKKELSNQGQEAYVVEASGFYDALGYMKGTHIESIKSDDGSGISGFGAIKKVVSRFFNFETNVLGEDFGSQKWLCSRQNYREFITDIWYKTGLYGDLKTTTETVTPLVAITSSGTFRLLNSKKHFKSKPKYRFTNRPAQNPNDIQINGKPEIINDAGLVNNFVKNKVNRVFNMVEGKFSDTKFNLKPLLALTEDLDSYNTTLKDGVDFLINPNVFPECWSNYVSNIGSLIGLSTVRLTMSFIGKHINDLYALDMVEYLEGKDDNLNITEGLYSGKYLVSKVVRTIGEGGNLQTHVVLTRESFNEIIDYAKEVTEVVLDIIEDGDLSQAIRKLNSIKSEIKDLLSLRNFKLNIPNIKILPQELKNLFNTLSGFDPDGIWVKLEHVVSSTEFNLVFDILLNIFDCLQVRGETKTLTQDNYIVDSITNDFSEYVENGFITIPNIGSCAMTPESISNSGFAWVVQGILTDNPQTGNNQLNTTMLDLYNYITTEGVINRQDSSIFRRFWGTSQSSSINEDELKLMYSDETNRIFIHKILKAKGYLYITYPTFMHSDNVSIKINNLTYTDLEITSKNMKVNGKYTEYTIIRTLESFDGRITLEVN